MADGVEFQGATPSYPPTDLKVSSDKTAGGYDVQRVKLAYSADASEVHVPADADGLLVNLGANNDVTVTGTVTANAGTGPFPVSDNAGSLTVDAPVGTPVFVRLSDGSSAIATLPVSLASVPSHAVTNAGTFAVQAQESRTRISVTPTVSSSPAYTASPADAVGGKLTFSNAARVSGGTIVIDSVTIVDLSQTLPALELVLFDRDFTASTDNAAFDPSDADLANCVGVIQLSNWTSFNDNAVATRSGIGLAVKLNGTDLYGQLLTRTAVTLAGTSDIIVTVTVKQD